MVNLQGSDTWTYVTTNQFGTGSAYALGAVTYSERSATRTGSGTTTTSSTTSSYEWHDAAVQASVVYKADKTLSTSWTSSYANSASGMLLSVAIADGRPRTVTYTNNAYGQVIRRDEADGNTGADDPHETWWRFGGREMGYVTNNNTLETDYVSSINSRTTPGGAGAFRNGATTGISYDDYVQPLDRISSYAQGSTLGSYTVQGGESLGAIAEQLWGDAALWYKLAEANGLSGAAPLAAGQVLTLPAGVMRNTHNAGTIRPYDPAKVVGDTSPTTPPPPKQNSCGMFGIIMMVVIAVAVTIVTSGAAVAALSGSVGTIGEGIGAVLGLSGAASVGAGTLVAAAAVGGAVGSIASQGFGIAIGAQHRINWKGVAIAGISSAVSAGIGQIGSGGNAAASAAHESMHALGVAGEAAAKTSQLGNVLSAFASGALRGAAANAATQGIARVTHLQDDFDFLGVALAGLGGGVGAAVGNRLPVHNNIGAIGQGLASGMASGVATAAARSIITGSDFGDNLMAALPDVIGQTIGNQIGGALAAGGGGQIKGDLSSTKAKVALGAAKVFAAGTITIPHPTRDTMGAGYASLDFNRYLMSDPDAQNTPLGGGRSRAGEEVTVGELTVQYGADGEGERWYALIDVLIGKKDTRALFDALIRNDGGPAVLAADVMRDTHADDQDTYAYADKLESIGGLSVQAAKELRGLQVEYDIKNPGEAMFWGALRAGHGALETAYDDLVMLKDLPATIVEGVRADLAYDLEVLRGEANPIADLRATFDSAVQRGVAGINEFKDTARRGGVSATFNRYAPTLGGAALDLVSLATGVGEVKAAIKTARIAKAEFAAERSLPEVVVPPKSPEVARIQGLLSRYPEVIDIRTGRPIQFPSDVGGKIPEGDRVSWGLKERGEFINEWYSRGYETPRGGWAEYDIHHIKPREYGGTNDFWNLTPVARQTHKELNAFWRGFTGL